VLKLASPSLGNHPPIILLQWTIVLPALAKVGTATPLGRKPSFRFVRPVVGPQAVMRSHGLRVRRAAPNSGWTACGRRAGSWESSSNHLLLSHAYAPNNMQLSRPREAGWLFNLSLVKLILSQTIVCKFVCKHGGQVTTKSPRNRLGQMESPRIGWRYLMFMSICDLAH